MPDDQYPPIMSLRQVSEYLGVSRAHLSNAINGKLACGSRLRCSRVGRRILVRREWADEWLERLAQETHQ